MVANFRGVYGVAVKDGLLFVKEQNTSIKVFQTSQITATSNWNLTPIAKLNTLNGSRETYSMEIADGNLVVAGRDSKGYLYYNIADILTNATHSLAKPISPIVTPFKDAKPLAVAFSTDWALTSENVGTLNYLLLYPKLEFMAKTYTPRINASDIMAANPFRSIVSTAQLGDRLFLADNTNKKIRIIKLNQSTIAEQIN